MSSRVPPIPPALSRLVQQQRVQAFLSAAVRENRLSHAYLFAGSLVQVKQKLPRRSHSASSVQTVVMEVVMSAFV
jgi:hypothetical protein